MCAIDFTNPDAVELVKSKIRKLMRMGVGVIKTDFSEELPEDAVFYDGSTACKATISIPCCMPRPSLRPPRRPRTRWASGPCSGGRSGYAGSQNYPANWAGDSSPI